VTGLRVPRAARRTLACQVKWFADNWDRVGPLLPLFTLLDEGGRPISFARELAEQLE
jgi:hypothetical protein